MRTTLPKKNEIQRRWVEIDADGKTLGRVAALAASLLRGKHRVIFTPHMDTGDFVIITNASGIRLTGNKATQKFHHRHSGYPGGLKSTSYEHLLRDKPGRLVEIAVRRMLPKNRLGRRLFTKLKVYSDGTHPHGPQKPVKIEVK
jgi:large subunit ribosomal protein L13